ncbi:hypothetical protein T02_14003 [Trichinella nativa]|uniref:Uncharacterized protein n=1 Tax=Trichinella nativa TaxID=6335 RepID=A0A0V1KYD8_9BILA|nr:hypothetical protein T02_14003 [Trichinella nativa]
MKLTNHWIDVNVTLKCEFSNFELHPEHLKLLIVQFTVRVQLNIEQRQANWWQLSASGSAFDFRGCWADVRGSQKSSVHNIVDLASHMFVGDVMPSRLVSISQ